MPRECPGCQKPLAETDTTCPACGRVICTDDQATVAMPSPGSTPASLWSLPSSATAEAPRPGALLAGRYQVLEVLGEGGMGAVYKVHDREVDRVVALKAIRPALAGSREILERFKRELVLARQITHPNIVRIYDLGTADGLKFITMEYIEGQDLDHVLRQRGKLKTKDAAEIMLQIARALEAAHAQGVIHRDLKPQNVMVSADGRVAVMDFGIARADQPLTAAEERLETLTQAGFLLGTPKYMSPEQARGDRIDMRSDLFSAGAIFFEMLTGHQPQEAPTPQITLARRISEPVRPPAALDPTVSRPLSDITARCLEMDLAKRYQSAGELVRDLEQLRAGGGKQPAGRGWIWAAAAAVAVLAAGVAMVALRPAASPQPVPTAAAPPPTVQSPPDRPAAPPPAAAPVPTPAAAPPAASKSPGPPARAVHSMSAAEQLAHARQLRGQGNLAEAEKLYQAVVKSPGSLPALDRHLAAAELGLIGRDPQAIAEYQAALQAAPGDAAILAGLATAYCAAGDITRALDAAQRGLEKAPSDPALRSQVALYQAYSGENIKAQNAARALIQSNPAFEPGYVVLAIAALTHHLYPMARQNYQRLSTVSASGKSVAAEGLADLAMAQGHYQEAVSILEPALAADLGVHDARAPLKLILLAQAALAQGDASKAEKYADRASEASREPAVLEPAAEVYLETGNQARAEALAAMLDGQPSPVSKASAQVVRAVARLRRHAPREAIRFLENSAQTVPTWLADYYLGRAHLELQQLPKAGQALTRCMQQWGQGADLFHRMSPTLRYYPPMLYYLARVREAQQFPNAANLYGQFLDLRGSGDGDQMVTDAKKKVGK
jgi:tetratricopeptide (TPR) repeat protein/predicted Ser/Thr protein kinase